MKCQNCSKPATLHITEIIKGEAHELHLCEEHARRYLKSESSEGSPSGTADMLAQQLAASTTAEELERLDKQSCPVCGIAFYEFRNQGRLGCPNDYEVFKNELLPLLENIHSESTHCGKVPQRAPGATKRHSELLRLRNDLKRSVAEENYEEAAKLRDRIDKLEAEIEEA